MLKKEVRVLGFDDGPFTKFGQGNVLVVGAFFRGGSFVDGILSTHVAVDGGDSTEKLVTLVNASKFKSQVQCIFLNGIAFGGFNVVNIYALHVATRVPVIVVVRRNPDLKKIKKILKRLKKGEALRVIAKAGHPKKVVVRGKPLYVQYVGITRDKVEALLELTCTRSAIPEPIRIAHLIARGIMWGESKGKA